MSLEISVEFEIDLKADVKVVEYDGAIRYFLAMGFERAGDADNISYVLIQHLSTMAMRRSRHEREDTYAGTKGT
jgi:hypothetical protein